MKKINFNEVIKEIIILTAAVAIIAAAVYFFLVPSHTSVSSISGLGIVLSNFVPLPLSAITMILNVVLLIIGFITCGKEFGVKTVYTSIMLPVFLGIFEKVFPNFTSMTDSQELDVLCYVLVVSIGLSILFRPKKITDDNYKEIKKSKDSLNLVAIFSGREEKVTTEFKGADCISVFGGIDLDLREASLKNDIVIEIVTCFGGVDILLPENVNVVTSGVPCFSSIENKTINQEKSKATIYINYVAIFGGIELK